MRLARATTCSLVSAWPSASMITPEPRLCAVRGRLGSKKSLKKRSKRGSPRKPSKGFACRTSVSVVMLTTAGPTFSTAWTAAVRRRNGSAARAAGAATPANSADDPQGEDGSHRMLARRIRTGLRDDRHAVDIQGTPSLETPTDPGNPVR